MPTIIGAIFFVCAVYCFLLKEDRLLSLLIIASVFQAASAINIGERGIQPYYFVSTFVIVRALLKRGSGIRSGRRMPQGAWLLIFGTITVASAFVLPVVFAGTPVYDPKIGIDDGLFIRPPLALGLNNAAQGLFLAWHVATAYAIIAINFSAEKAYKAYIWAFYIVVAVVALQSFCQMTGIPFPHSLILNNPGYSLWGLEQEAGGMRNPGTFAEPSLAGGFLVMYFVGFLANYLAGRGDGFRVILALVASGLVTSSGSLLTLSLFTLALLIRYFPFRLPWFINIPRTKRLVLIVLVFAVPLALLLMTSSPYTDTLMTNTVSKGDSSSFINRTAADLYALQLLVQTHGIGVGMGSNRASSLLTTLLSNVGILGVVAFGMFYIGLFAKLADEYAWLRWAGFALLANMCVNIPDVTIPTLWVPVLLAIQFSVVQVPASSPSKSRTLSTVLAHEN